MELAFEKRTAGRPKKGSVPPPKEAINLKFPPLEEWQQPVFNDFTARTYDTQLIVSKRQIGKSLCCEICALWKSFSKPNSINVIIEPTLAQGRRIFRQILRAIGGDRAEVLKSSNSTLLEIEFINGSVIQCKSGEQREGLRGLTVTGVLVIDEGAFIQDDIFQILYPCLDAHRAPLIIASTPMFMSGEFYSKYLEGLTPNKYTHTYDWSEYDTSKYLPEEKLAYYRDRLSPLRFRSEYEGRFIEANSLAMGNIAGVIGEMSSKPSVYGGLDWGNGGENDYTVLITLDEGGSVAGIYPTNNLQPTEQVDYYSNILNGLNLRVTQVEINSIGTVYYDFLQKGVRSYIAKFLTSNDSKRRIIEQLIRAIQRNEITIPADGELINQLQHYDMQKTKTGYTYNGVGAHDDYVIALALAYDAYLSGMGTFEISFA